MLVGLAIVTLSSCAITNIAEPSVVESGGTRTVPGASLVTREGIPFLSLSGSYEEMGFQYGSLLREELKRTVKEMDSLVKSAASLAPWYASPFVPLYLRLESSSRMNEIPEKYRHEIEGISRGSGISSSDLALLVFFPDMVSSISCTSVVGPGSNGVLHARNLDFVPPGLLGKQPIIIDYHPEGKIHYTLASIVGSFPGLTGMNDSGITASLNQVVLVKNSKGGAGPIGYKLRDILESAGTLAEVDSELSSYGTNQGWILTIGSQKDRTWAIYDIAGDKIVKRKAQAGPMFAVNTFEDRKLDESTMSISEDLAGFNIRRMKRLSSMIDAGPRFSVDGLLRILSDTNTEAYGPQVGFFTVNNYETVQTVIMDPEKNRLYMASAPGYAAWGRVIAYDRVTGTVSSYREADPRLDSPEVKNLSAWIDNYFAKPTDCETYVDLSANSPECMVEMALRIEDMGKLTIDSSKLLDVLDSLIDRYPGYAWPLYRKAELFLKKGRYREALEYAERGLSAAVLYPDDEVSLVALAARSCEKLGLKEEAHRYATMALKSIEPYTGGKFERKVRDELDGIAGSIP
jgi:hypothetical protein